MSQDEIAVMDGGKCIMQLRGVRPFFSDKFDITRHRRYKELSDFDSKNAFDIEDYVKHLHRMKVTPDTEVQNLQLNMEPLTSGHCVQKQKEFCCVC